MDDGFVNKPPVVVTRHRGLVDYLRQEGVEVGCVIEHATVDLVKDRVVYGVLPLRLAAEAREVREVPLDLPAELCGKELTAEDVRKYAGPIRSYRVRLEGVVPPRLLVARLRQVVDRAAESGLFDMEALRSIVREARSSGSGIVDLLESVQDRFPNPGLEKFWQRLTKAYFQAAEETLP